MKREVELSKHILDNTWRSYTCGCKCWHSKNDEIHRHELILTELNEVLLP